MEPTDRLHALDAVRAIALLLGVLLHAAAAFLQDFPIPAWRDEPSAVAAVIFYTIHMFRMSAFFLIAGFFARLVRERRGTRAFLKDRAKRIAIPLFVFGPFVLLLIGIFAMLGAMPHGVEFMQAQMTMPSEVSPDNIGEGSGVLAHLWFLYYLLWFYAGALLLRAALGAVGFRETLAAAADRLVALAMRGVWAPVVVAVPLIVPFALDSGWTEWLGLPAPQSLLPTNEALLSYGFAFGLGWLLHRQLPLVLQLQHAWMLYLAAAMLLTVASLAIVGLTPRWNGSYLEGARQWLYASAYFIGSWCWSFALIGAAVRFLSNERPRLRYLADASYWIYLMHMAPLIMLLVFLRPYALHWAVTLVLVVLGALPLLLLSYHYWIRYTWVGAVLNGKRQPRVVS